jgi:hypothetical protein
MFIRVRDFRRKKFDRDLELKVFKIELSYYRESFLRIVVSILTKYGRFFFLILVFMFSTRSIRVIVLAEYQAVSTGR